jgi:hypothetical protein
MRLCVILLDVDHAADHAYGRGHENVVTHLIAPKILARATGGWRSVPYCIRGGQGRRVLELGFVSSRHP